MKQKEKLERLLFVSEVKQPGDEPKVRAVVEHDFPAAAFEKAGAVGFTVSIGGGYCIFEFGFEGEFDGIFERLNEAPEVREFFTRLERYVAPVPRIEPGKTAELPLAADIFMWRKEGGTTAREPARPRETRRETGT